MKLTALVFTAMAALSQAETERGLASLAEKWNISDPVFAYESLSFELTYNVSDYIGANDGMVQYVIYDQFCADGDPANSYFVYMVGNSTTSSGGSLTYTENPDNTGTEGISDVTANDVAKASFDQLGGDNLNQEVSINITLDADTISTNDYLYAEDPSVGAVTAEIRFCVRFSLWTPGSQTTATEVNFLETIVTLNVDLSDGFEIGSIAVEPKDRIVRTANQVYQVRAFQCIGTTEMTPAQKAATQNQGSVIRVCVTPDAEAYADGIRMRAIDSFTFVRDADSVDEVEQIAVAGRAAALNLLTTYDDAACRGQDVCWFETILFAQFYTSLGQVFGAGVASMQFGSATSGRRLREGGRQVQEEPAAAAEFELEFGVTPTDEVPSGASSVGALMTGLLALTGVAALL